MFIGRRLRHLDESENVFFFLIHWGLENFEKVCWRYAVELLRGEKRGGVSWQLGRSKKEKKKVHLLLPFYFDDKFTLPGRTGRQFCIGHSRQLVTFSEIPFLRRILSLLGGNFVGRFSSSLRSILFRQCLVQRVYQGSAGGGGEPIFFFFFTNPYLYLLKKNQMFRKGTWKSAHSDDPQGPQFG